MKAWTMVAAHLAFGWLTAVSTGADEQATPTGAAPQRQTATAPDDACGCPAERDTLTDNWLGLGRPLDEAGLAVALGLTQICQHNLHGGLSTHRRSGRYAGSYDLEIDADLEALAKLPGGRLYLLARGSWSDGVDPPSVGSLFGANADAAADRAIDVWQLFYEQAVLPGKLWVRLGKIDLTGGFECRGCPASFDGSQFANDETGQFLNGALVNNPTIPFPDPGRAAIVHLEAVEGWYVSAAAADADADVRETGLRTGLHGRDEFFSIFETGLTPRLASPRGPLQGAYRVGLWYSGATRERFDGGSKRDDVGCYASCGQCLWKENRQEDDEQGLGAFARYGLAHADANEVKGFWSAGVQYQGLLPSRDDDVVGLGVAQGRLSRQAGLTERHETALELYYKIAVTHWLEIAPEIQYVINPGGAGGDAVVAGVRVQIAF